MDREFVVLLIHNNLSADSVRIKQLIDDTLIQEWPDVGFMVQESDGDFDFLKLVHKDIRVEHVPSLVFLTRTSVSAAPKVLRIIDPADFVTLGTIRDTLYEVGAEPDISLGVEVVKSPKKKNWLKYLWMALGGFVIIGGGYFIYKNTNDV